MQKLTAVKIKIFLSLLPKKEWINPNAFEDQMKYANTMTKETI